MTFEEALPLIKRGFDVRRSAWNTSQGLRADGAGIVTLGGTPYALAGCSLMSNDWELINEEIAPNLVAIWTALLAGKKLTRHSWTHSYIHLNSERTHIIDQDGHAQDITSWLGWIVAVDL